MENETKPWERQKGEKNLWYSRYFRFLLMGPDRSLLATYNEWQDTKGHKRTRTPATSWRKACEKWNWRKRAEAWDKAERQRLQAEYETERLEWREKRNKFLQKFFGKLDQALIGFNPADVSLGALTQAIRMAVQELRAEFDDEPTARYDISIGLDEPTRQLLAQVGGLAGRCITEPEMRQNFMQGLERLIGEDDEV